MDGNRSASMVTIFSFSRLAKQYFETKTFNSIFYDLEVKMKTGCWTKVEGMKVLKKLYDSIFFHQKHKNSNKDTGSKTTVRIF